MRSLLNKVKVFRAGYEGDIQSLDFMNLKGRLKVHLQSQKYVAKEVQKKKENEKQLLSRNQLAAPTLRLSPRYS